jgi:hypothetical protein
MTTGAADDAYLLPEEENRRIFSARIVPDHLAPCTSQEQPVAVFLVGQPGAGKSRISELVGRVLDARGGYADIDSDLFKPHHPAYAELLAEDDTQMARLVGPDGRRWMAQAQEWVREHRVNAVVQEISEDSNRVLGSMRAYRDAGFDVEAIFLAVPKALSDQGIVSRYHEQVKSRGQGRLTVQAKADQAYGGIVDLARRIDGEQLVDQVSVFRRGEDRPRYANFTVGGRWFAAPTLAAAVEEERARPWTVEETAGFLEVHGRLVSEMGPSWSDRLDQIRAEAAPLMAADAPIDRVQRAIAVAAGSVAAGLLAHGVLDNAVEPIQRDSRRHGPDLGF